MESKDKYTWIIDQLKSELGNLEGTEIELISNIQDLDSLQTPENTDLKRLEKDTKKRIQEEETFYAEQKQKQKVQQETDFLIQNTIENAKKLLTAPKAKKPKVVDEHSHSNFATSLRNVDYDQQEAMDKKTRYAGKQSFPKIDTIQKAKQVYGAGGAPPKPPANRNNVIGSKMQQRLAYKPPPLKRQSSVKKNPDKVQNISQYFFSLQKTENSLGQANQRKTSIVG